MNQPQDVKLPDLLTFQTGRPVKNADDWRRRRAELLELILGVEYGPMPAPAAVEAKLLHHHTIDRLEGTRHFIYLLSIGGYAGVQFHLDLFYPPGKGAFPVVLNGDTCWRYITDDITMDVLHRGNILATFDRNEVFADEHQPDLASGLFRLYPGSEITSLAAWAWSYHRALDFLATLPDVDAGRMAITGHSRGGKTTLLAAATDERIALANANGSGCAGASCYRAYGPQAETLAILMHGQPQWYSPNMRQFVGKETTLPLDQHFLVALAALEPLLITEALGDLPANPTGAWHTYTGAKRAYQFLGAESKIGISYRQGIHEHNRQDWATLLDFVDLHFHGKSPGRRFDTNPFGY